MTTEEQKNIIGGAVLEYAQVKQKIAALQQELENKLATVRDFEKAMRMREIDKATPLLSNWPSADFFSNTFAEIEQHRERKATLEQTMKQYGIDLP